MNCISITIKCLANYLFVSFGAADPCNDEKQLEYASSAFDQQ